MGDDFIVETKNLTKEFKGFVAVSDVNLKVRRHTIHALIGPNGAGKTTCFNLITKFLPLSRGTITLNGRDITNTAPADIARLGMVRSFQISAVFGHLTALENVRVALQRKLGTSFQFWKSDKSLAELNDRAEELLVDVGVQEYRDIPAGELSYGRKRALEIATTLALDPEMLLLDEPMAGMGPEDGRAMVDLLQSLKGERTILLVEHDMDAVFQLADRISVLVYGAIIASGTPDHIRADAEVRRAYLGEEA